VHTVPTEKKSFDGEDDTDIPRASPANGRSFTSSPHASSSLPLFWLLKQRAISDNEKIEKARQTNQQRTLGGSHRLSHVSTAASLLSLQSSTSILRSHDHVVPNQIK
jgi:hypothetical protein